jgi:hypothetical protein
MDVHVRTDRAETRSSGALNEARLLAVLEAGAEGMTIAALRERGIHAPGQAVYALQLAGYQIERVYCRDSDGHSRLGYRLCASTAPAPDPPNGQPQTASSAPAFPPSGA